MNNLLIAIAALFFAPVLSVAADYGGTVSPDISGNIIKDVFYQEKDSLLFCLTSSGLSYARVTPSVPGKMQWNNFSSETFKGGLEFVSVAADDSTVFVAGYGMKGQNFSGGGIYYKTKGAAGFTEYYPGYRDDTTDFRLPYDVYVGDSNVYISMFAGHLLKNSLPPSALNWSAVLFTATDLKSLIAGHLKIRNSLAWAAESLHLYRDTLILTDTALFRRLAVLNTDTTSAHVRVVKLTPDSDSVAIRWETFRLDTAHLSRTDFRDTVPMVSLDQAVDAIMDSIIISVTALNGYMDTLRNRYGAIVAEIPADLYPPDDYGYKYSVRAFSVIGKDSLLFVGSSGGLMVSTSSDSHRSFREVLHSPGSSLLYPDGSVPQVGEVYVQPFGPDTFRLWILSLGDSVAFSAKVPGTAVDSMSFLPEHLDSLEKWNLFTTEYGVTDLCFFKDTTFISYGNREGIRKYFQDSSKTWVSVSIPITDFLEPQLGINTIAVVTVDSIRGTYELWAGTDDGLYRLRPGTAAWEFYEYKRPMDKSHGETYSYPTIIRPAYKSAKIAYSLAEDARVTIEVFDFSMRKVKTIVKNAARRKGDPVFHRSDVSQEDRWDGRDDRGRAVAPGVYYYKVSTSKVSMFGKFMVFGSKDYGDRE